MLLLFHLAMGVHLVSTMCDSISLAGKRECASHDIPCATQMLILCLKEESKELLFPGALERDLRAPALHASIAHFQVLLFQKASSMLFYLAKKHARQGHSDVSQTLLGYS